MDQTFARRNEAVEFGSHTHDVIVALQNKIGITLVYHFVTINVARFFPGNDGSIRNCCVLRITRL